MNIGIGAPTLYLAGEPKNQKGRFVNWKTTRFERQCLFDEVWATPVTKLAKGYGLSDVGLRKICVALDVPLPPRGYWQKLAAGKRIPKPALHATNVKTTYARSMYVAQVDEVLEERVVQARGAIPDAANTERPDYSPPLGPAAFSAQAKLVIRAMKSTKLDEGALTSVGVTWADISVSKNLKERALLLADRFAHELKILGAEFENSHPSLPPLRRGLRRESGSKRNGITLHGQSYFIHIRERITQELVPPLPPKPLRARARQPEWKYQPPEYRWIPTGKLHIAIVDASTYYDSIKIEDTIRGTIEVKIKNAVRAVDDAALRRKVENEVRAEREAVRRRKSQEWDVAKAHKDVLLKQLASFEKMAKDLDRARSLRRFVDEIAASKAAPAKLAGSLGLMTLMADWLDPLVNTPWPEVDSVGEKNPFGFPW